MYFSKACFTLCQTFPNITFSGVFFSSFRNYSSHKLQGAPSVKLIFLEIEIILVSCSNF